MNYFVAAAGVCFVLGAINATNDWIAFAYLLLGAANICLSMVG